MLPSRRHFLDDWNAENHNILEHVSYMKSWTSEDTSKTTYGTPEMRPLKITRSQFRYLYVTVRDDNQLIRHSCLLTSTKIHLLVSRELRFMLIPITFIKRISWVSSKNIRICNHSKLWHLRNTLTWLDWQVLFRKLFSIRTFVYALIFLREPRSTFLL